jgi:hypothetical protein
MIRLGDTSLIFEAGPRIVYGYGHVEGVEALTLQLRWICDDGFITLF